MNFRELIKDWEDQDIAAYYLACCLGLAVYDASFNTFRETKRLFWTKNPTSKLLYEMLEKMVESEMLEFDDDETRYRWNNAFEQS